MPDWDIIVYDPSRPRPTSAPDAPAFSRLPMLAVAHGSARPDLGQPVAVRERYDISYVRLLQGIDFCLKQRVDVLNLSLGPARLLPSTTEDPDPLYVATDVVRQLGVPVIVAAGNKGPAPDTLQFLARATWVVAVGTISQPDPRFPKPSTSWAAPKVAAVAGWTKLTSATVELKTTLSGGPGVDASFHALQLSGSYTHSEIQTLTISLTPRPPAIELMSPVSDQLIDAIAAISSAAREAAVSEPKFDLQEATISLNIGVDKQGNAMIIVGGSADSSNYHTLTLNVKSS